MIPSLVLALEPDSARSARADSISILRHKYRGQTTVEELVSLPGYVVYAPLKFVFEFQKFLIQQAFETRIIEGNIITEVVDVFISNDGRRGIIPTYSSSAGGGLKFYQRGWISPKSKLSLSATMGLRGRQRYQLKFKNVEFGPRVNSQLLVKYHFQSDESFYGIGPASSSGDRTNFANKFITADLNVGVQVGGNNRIGIIAGFDRNDISHGRNKRYPSTTDIASFAALPGMEGEVKMGRLQLEIYHDSRNHPGRPTTGVEAILRGDVYQQVGDDKYGFSQLYADASYYFHLFFNRALKVRFAGELRDPFKNRQIPFFYLSELGRSETIRGFTRGRFRDRDMILGSVEYIYPIWERINAHLFFDTGTVSPNILKYFDTAGLKNGYGIGFSVWDNEGILGNFATAHSSDGFRFYLDLNVSL
jgi:hypothetical protein